MSNELRDEQTIAIDMAIGDALGWPNGVYDATDAVLAAITTPQVVETVGTVHELAVAHLNGDRGFVVVMDAHFRPWIAWEDDNGDPWASSFPSEDDNPERQVTRWDRRPAEVLASPATILYPHPTPDVDVIAEVRALARRMRHEAGCAFVQSRIGNGLGHIECDCNKGALTAILDREAGR